MYLHRARIASSAHSLGRTLVNLRSTVQSTQQDTSFRYCGAAAGENSEDSSRSARVRGQGRKHSQCILQSTMSTGNTSKLKLMCLHGYMQNSEIFRSRLGSMRKALKNRVEFIFLDAPFVAQGLSGGDEPDEAQAATDGRSWWQWTDKGPDGRPSKAASYTGWEHSQEVLLQALQEHQPDGLLGFSQGATAAALLLACLAAKNDQPTCGQKLASSLKVAILIAGFLPRDPNIAKLAQKWGGNNSVPLFFVTGASDQLVPPERTNQLSACFGQSLVSSYTHTGGHLVPTCSGHFKTVLVEFLDAAASCGPVIASHYEAPPQRKEDNRLAFDNFTRNSD